MEKSGTHGAREKRRAPRLNTRCEISVLGDASMLDMEAKGDADPYQLTLCGNTCDMSAAGLALVLPAFSPDEKFCTDAASTLTVNLQLPTATVSLRAAPVHCKPLNPVSPGDGSIIGVRIMEMDEEDCERYLKYLGTSH